MSELVFGPVYTRILGQLPRPTDNGDVHVNCIFHNDPNPSLVINLKDGRYHCFGCKRKGNAPQFVERIYSVAHQTAKKWVDEALVGRVESIPTLIPLAQVKFWHDQLQQSPSVKDFLTRTGGDPLGKGLTNETIQRFMLGWDGDRITIPIPGEFGQIVNVRRYKMGVKRGKFVNFAEGYGEARLYPIRNLLESSTVWLFEGEWDCLLANQLGLPAVTTTGGAGTWKNWWNELFRDKTVYVVYDVDQAGRGGAEAVCKNLASVAKEVRNVLLPIDNGDFSDWILRGGGSVDELRRIASNTTPVEKPKTADASSLVDVKSPVADEVSLKELIDSYHWRMTSTGPQYNSSLAVPKHVLTDAVIEWFKHHGGSFVWSISEQQGYLFFKNRRYTLQSNDPELLSMLQYEGGINAQDSEGRVITAALCNCRAFAIPAEFSSWWTSVNERVLRLAQSPEMPVLEIGVTESNEPFIREVENGDGGVWQMFANDGPNAEFVPFEFDPNVDKREALSLLYELCVSHFSVSDVRREIITTWFLTLLISHLSSIRPGLRISGTAGSGKSTILQLLFWLLYGTRVGLLPTYTVASLWRVGLVEPVLFIDNQNVEAALSEDLRTFFDLAATGGVRKLAADNKGRRTVVQKVHSLVAVSGLDSFLAPDVLTRYFEVETDPDIRKGGAFFPTRDRDKLLAARAKIWSGIIKLLAEDVLPTIFSTPGSSFVAKIREINHRKERTSDYLSLMTTWGLIISKYEPRLVKPVEGNLSDEEKALELARRWCEDIGETAVETSVSSAATIEWWETFRQQIQLNLHQLVVQKRYDDHVEEVVIVTPSPLSARLIRQGNFYVGIEGTPAELLNALRWTASQVRERLPWNSTRQLGQAYRAEKDAWELEELGWRRVSAGQVGVTINGKFTVTTKQQIFWPSSLAIPKVATPQVETDSES